MYFLGFVVVLLIFQSNFELIAQSPEKSICASKPSSNALVDSSLEQLILESLESILGSSNYDIKILPMSNREERLDEANQRNCSHHLEIQYTKKQGQATFFYGQIYDPKTKKL